MYIREKFNQWCEVTTCAGVIDWHIARTRIGKIFWSILLAVCLCLTSWQTFSFIWTIINDNPYLTTSRMIANQPLPFPSVTVCNFNRIDKTKIRQDLDKHVLAYGFIPLHNDIIIDENLTVENYETKWQEMKRNLNVTDLYDLFQTYGHSCEDTFVLCVWATVKFDCCSRARPIVGSTLGKCWFLTPPDFNSDRNTAQQNTAGPDFGLKMIINPKLEAYYFNSLFGSKFWHQGVLVEAGFAAAINFINFKVITPGVKSWISMKANLHTVKEYDTPLFKPHCRQNTTLTYINASYSINNCILDCWAGHYYKLCKCTMFAEPKKPYRVCDTKEMLKCIDGLCSFNDPNPEKLCRKKGRICQAGCLTPCEPYWDVVDTSQTSTTFINKNIREDVWNSWQHVWDEQGISNESLDNLIGVTLYYSTLSYAEIETGEANPIFDIIGNIGGQLSLWLGISFVTIIQTIWYILNGAVIKSAPPKLFSKENCVSKIKL